MTGAIRILSSNQTFLYINILGVILSPILSLDDDVKTALLILNAKTMTEIARAEVPTGVLVPFTFHGLFSNKL